MRDWMRNQLIGFSIKSMEELERIISLDVVNLIEIKLEKFAENGTPLYFYEDGEFIMNHRMLKDIVVLTAPNSILVQFHLPIEREMSLVRETGINIGIIDHHKIAMKRFMLLERIHALYGIGQVITVHPPTVSFAGKRVITERQALENARIFYERFDQIRYQLKHQTLIGLENQADKKTEAGMLGYLPSHFKAILRNTRTIGLTFDSGHRRLTKHFTVSRLLQFSIPIVNFHFHGNSGEFRKDNFDDDSHNLPTADNVKGYPNYLRYFRRNRPPVILEIAYLEKYSNQELIDFVNNFKRETE